MSIDVQKCEVCGHEVGLAAVGPCPKCNGFYFPGGDVHPRENVRQPANLTCTREHGAFTLRWRWANRTGLGVLLISLTVAAVCLALGDFVFPIVLAGPGIYWGLSQTLNSTWITVKDGWLRVRSGPVPVRRALALRTSDIRQLLARAELRKTRWNSSRAVSNTSVHEVYHLLARVGTDDSLRVVVPNVPQADLALFMEHAIERELGVRDEPVQGELRR